MSWSLAVSSPTLSICYITPRNNVLVLWTDKIILGQARQPGKVSRAPRQRASGELDCSRESELVPGTRNVFCV